MVRMVLLVMEVGKTPRNGENRTRTVSVVFDLRPHARLEARVHWFLFVLLSVNDPSAGSPTETLLRLLLPLDEQICMTLGNRSTTEVVSRPLSERLIDSSNR